MVAMVRRCLTLTVVMLVLAGCYDRFPGPDLQNTLDADVALSITYTDGKIASFTLPPGRSVLISRGDLPEGGIQWVVVQEGGKIIHRLNRDEVRLLVEKQRKHKTYAIWCIDREDIYLFEPNPPDTGGCTQGKRIE